MADGIDTRIAQAFCDRILQLQYPLTARYPYIELPFVRFGIYHQNRERTRGNGHIPRKSERTM
jgi:hypothetical protein